MDETPVQPTTQSVSPTSSAPSKKPQNKIGKLAAISALFLVILLIAYFVTKFKVIQPKSIVEYDANQLLATVGKEKLLYKDLSDYASTDNFSVFSPTERDSVKKNSQALVGRYLPRVIEQSVILQEGQKNNLVKLPVNFFTKNDKDFKTRKQYEDQIVKAVDQKVQKITVDTLTVYYFQNRNSATLVKTALENYRQKISSNLLTFSQADKQIASDTALTNLSSFNKRAYFQYKNVPINGGIFPNPELTDTIFNQNINALSPVTEVIFITKDNKRQEVKKAVGFTIFRVINREGSLGLSFSQWLSDTIKKYNIKKTV